MKCRTLGGLWILVLLSTALSARADLVSFLREPDPAYRWSVVSTSDAPGVKVYKLSMVSQLWHGITWNHNLLVFRPEHPRYPDFCALLNTGGGGSAEAQLGVMAAARTGATFAVLEDEPNQPLFGGLEEDALVVYTWKKYLETGDESWLLHWAMTKAIIRAIDTVQALAKQEHQPDIRRFLITGASKRGWNSWLAGASRDRRIVAIAPMVIDTLNLGVQVPHQLAAYGQPSEQVSDYTNAGMLEQLNTPAGKRLMQREDPYSYRDTLTLPKLLILGTNDRYWAQDALNQYWDGLQGPKWVSYTPNSGHGLEDKLHVFNVITAFIDSVASGHPFPTPSWSYAAEGDGATLTVTCTAPIVSARLFHVEAPTQDFRNSHWTSDPMTESGSAWTGHLAKPASGYAAMFGEVTCELDGHTFTLSTQIRILGP